jgi:hypothetical protein
MTTTAVESRPDRAKSDSKPDRVTSLWVPVLVAIISGVLALIVAVWVPRLTQAYQDHAKRLQVETSLATDMNRSLTMALGAAQRVGLGLALNPVLGDPQRNAAAIQHDYNDGLARWRVNSGRVTANLSARYPGEAGAGVVGLWRSYVRAVTQFYRLGAVIPRFERSELLKNLRSYIDAVEQPTALGPKIPDTSIKWDALGRLKQFRKSLVFRTNYNTLNDKLLALGEGYVQLLLTLKPVV